MSNFLTCVAVLILCLGISAAAAAPIYRWVDDKGQVHYTDQPPPGVESTPVEIDSAPDPDALEPDERLSDTVEESQRRRQRRAAEKQKEDAAERAQQSQRAVLGQQCLQARTQLAILQEQLPIYRDDEGQLRVQWGRRMFDDYQGERTYLDDTERASEVGQARENINATCRNPDDAAEQASARERWMQSELCAAAQAELRWLEEPRLRTPESELERKRAEAKKYCDY